MYYRRRPERQAQLIVAWRGRRPLLDVERKTLAARIAHNKQQSTLTRAGQHLGVGGICEDRVTDLGVDDRGLLPWRRVTRAQAYPADDSKYCG